MRVEAQRIGFALAFTAVTASAAVLLAYTKSAGPRLIDPSTAMVEAAYTRTIPSEVIRDPGYWYPMIGENSN